MATDMDAAKRSEGTEIGQKAPYPVDCFLKYMTDGFVLAVAGNPGIGDAAGDLSGCTKIKMRPIVVKKQQLVQVTKTVGAKEIHENMAVTEAARLLDRVTGKPFRQIEVSGAAGKLTVLVSKKGRVSMLEHRTPGKNGGNTAVSDTAAKEDRQYSHNRQKNYCLPEGVPVPFLVELGVMTGQGRVIAQKYDKFRQINRYLEFVEDIIPSLPKDRELSIIDFGCGKSYLTFALYYYLHEVKGFDVRITGLDLKEDVIAHCNELALRFGYEKLKFLHGDIATYGGDGAAAEKAGEKGLHVDMVVTLHACDTATDYALEKAVKWGAGVIFCVPCCQHELNRQIKCAELDPILKYGLLKERIAALVTDGLRANMLEEAGYRTQILEFIDMEHTPKNILIRAVRQPMKIKRKTGFRAAAEFLNAEPTLEKLLWENR